MRILALAALAFISSTVSVLADGEAEKKEKKTAGVVSVIGEVTSPQNLSFTEGMTLTEAIDAAGGLTDFAGKGKRVKIIRKGKTTRYDLSDEDLEDPELKPGDVISVPSGG